MLCQCKKSKDPCLVQIQEQEHFTVVPLEHNASALHKAQKRWFYLSRQVHVTNYFICIQ